MSDTTQTKHIIFAGSHDELLSRIAAQIGVVAEIAYPAHEAEWYLELLQADTELDKDATERAADADWLTSNQSDWGYKARRAEFVGALTDMAYGTYYEMDPRTAAQIDADAWEAETRATRESDYPR
jgi:hypothetical protein